MTIDFSSTISWQEYIGDKKQEDKSVLVAWCNSTMCVSTRQKTTAQSFGKIKFVSKNTNWCPDCGSALFWCKEAKKQSVRRNYKRKKK